MPRHTARQTDKGLWTQEDLTAALKAIRSGEISKNEAHKRFRIGRATLDRYLKSSRGGEALKISMKTKNMVFTEAEEEALARYAIECSRMFYGLTINELQRVAYQFAKANKRPCPSSWERDGCAGKDWALGFRSRRGLSLRTPENTSLARAAAFNPTNVGLFHTAYSSALARGSFQAANIWNLDETGVSTVTKPQRVITCRGERHVGCITSAERGVTVTMCACINAAGRALAPVLIYPRVRIQPHFARLAPPGSLALAQPTGWMTREIFPEVLEHFFDQMACSLEQPNILLFDNHSSHMTLEVVTLARQRGVIIVTFPAHCSHRMQPLDVGVFGPWKTYYAEAVQRWHQEHPGKILTIHEIEPLVTEAFGKAFTIPNIVNSFRAAGVWPVDANVFTDADFMSARPTAFDNPTNEEAARELEIPSTSGSRLINPEEIRPFPQIGRQAARGRGRAKRVPVVLTSTPEKNKLKKKKT